MWVIFVHASSNTVCIEFLMFILLKWIFYQKTKPKKKNETTTPFEMTLIFDALIHAHFPFEKDKCWRAINNSFLILMFISWKFKIVICKIHMKIKIEIIFNHNPFDNSLSSFTFFIVNCLLQSHNCIYFDSNSYVLDRCWFIILVIQRFQWLKIDQLFVWYFQIYEIKCRAKWYWLSHQKKFHWFIVVLLRLMIQTDVKTESKIRRWSIV